MCNHKVSKLVVKIRTFRISETRKLPFHGGSSAKTSITQVKTESIIKLYRTTNIPIKKQKQIKYIKGPFEKQRFLKQDSTRSALTT